MIRRILSLLRPEPVEVPDLIATRAARVCNRKPEAIAKYRRVHEILKRGPRA